MAAPNISNPRSGRLIKLFHDCVSGTRSITSSQDAKHFFEAVDVFCQQKSPSVCVETILSNKQGCHTVESAVKSNLSSAFISSSTMGFLQHLRDPPVKTINDGSFLAEIMIAMLCPPTFWDALKKAYLEKALDKDGLLTFAWLCFEIVSSHSPDLQGLFSDVKTLLEKSPFLAFDDEAVREIAYKIQKVVRIRAAAPSTSSAAIAYSPGGRHDNDFEDFRKISIYPTADEMVSTQQPFLQRLDDVFEVPSGDRPRTHLDWLFRLLREDMLGELREDLQVAWGQKQAKRRPLSLSKLSILTYDTGDRYTKPFTLFVSCLQGIHIPRLKTTEEARIKFFEENKKFIKHNSFGALCLDRRVVAFGSVIRDVEMLAQKIPAIGIQFTDAGGLKRALTELLGARRAELQFYIVDTATFAYQPILRRLQEITELPVENELLSLQEEAVQDQEIPSRLERFLDCLWQGISMGEKVDLSQHIPMEKPISVGGAQLKSLINGLESPLGQIQGPPGTGKSFIGALLVLIFLKLTSYRILVLSYTNHALDQFLEDLMDIGIDSETIVRLGSKGTTRTDPLRIDKKKRETRHRLSPGMQVRLNEEKLEHAKIDNLLRGAMRSLTHPVSDAEILDMLEFDEQGIHFWQAFQVPDEDGGFRTLGKKNRALKAEDLYDNWKKGKTLHSLGHVRHFVESEAQAVWDVPHEQRLQLHHGWCDQLRQEKLGEFVQLAQRSNDSHSKIESLFNESKRDILRSNRVIGCTTTAAAMFQSIIKSAEPDVVLVEEAGEILEAHVITALSPSVKQLILIGDHKQLRPKVNNYNLTLEGGEGFDLNVSLFERLIRQDHKFTTLQEQHRSHPDISAFARLLAYEELTDNPKTLSRERIRGLSERVAFVHHEHPEEQLTDVADRRDPSSKASKKNAFEAEMVLRTVKYLSQQGYKAENMVVLTPYLGQLSLLKEMLSEINDPYLNDLDSHELVRAGLMTPAAASASKAGLRLSTIDNYQGEESDIVIVSMTRSNSRGDIGFLIARERLVVLMSRARCGIILFGNMNTFMANKKCGDMWKTYFDALKQKGFLFDGLPVKCEQHPERSALIKNAKDFDQHCPDGGCAEPCDKPLGCGKHKCELRCHRLPDHSKAPCHKEVSRTCERGHKSKVRCGNENQGCRDCAREDRETRRRAQRDLELEKSRLEREEKYRQQLEEMDDEIDHCRRVMQYGREEEEQKNMIEKKKAELKTLQDIKSRVDAAKENAKRSIDKIKAGNASSSGRPNQNWHDSNSAQEWQVMKTSNGAANSALDELMDLIGLESVKAEFLSIKSLVDQKIRMGVSLEKERLSCSLLGNPGTGKTTVARFYGDFLMNIGAIAGNSFKESSGAKLANIGVSGCEKLIEEIKDNGGGVLFIDEAYQLSSGNSPGGKAVLDFLLTEVENLRGKVVFVLAGYAKQMESFFAHNPGFPSRFPIEMKFEDYSDQELRQILELQVDRKYDGRMKVEGLADGLFFRIAARRVGRGRGKEGFGNARAIENALARIEKRQVNRIRAERRAKGEPDDFFFTKEDIIGPEPSMALDNCEAWEKLNGMIGINQVKQQVKTLLDSLKTNYDREINEEPLLQFSLNQVFLGSPGTGKTTVAGLYGQILADLGLLSNGEVVIKTPADFIGAYIGHSEAQTKGILAATVGKVLVIDEAYGLYGRDSNSGDSFKTAVVDTIVGEVQNVPGDDRCVILVGYKEQMDEMFRNVNPGLSRRFSVDNPFVFEDFDDDGLRQVLELKIKGSGFTTAAEGLRVALDVLIRERNRPNFGNGGAIENLLSRAKLSYQKRMSAGKIRRNQLDPVDFDEEFERSTRKETNVRQLFQGDIGRDAIIEMLENVQSRVRQLKALGLDVTEEIPFNFLFRGPPGTGKSTTARKMGKVYYDMGFLSDATVIDCSATDLIGKYIGHTGPKVQAVLDRALGKVLLIDEAYRLAEDGHFAKEAIDELVDCLTKPKYQCKLIVILAGYDKEINRLLAVNPGLSSRFPETVNFEPLSPEHCFELLVSLLQQRKRDLARKGKELDLSCMESPPQGFKGKLISCFRQLSALEGWASARDVKTLARNIFRTVDLDAQALKLERMNALEEIVKMHHERKGRVNTGSPLPSVAKIPLRATPRPQSDNPTNIAASSNTSTGVDPQKAQSDDADNEPGQQPPTEDPGKVDDRRSGMAMRDAGVSDEVWEQLQQDRAEEQRREEQHRKLIEAGKTAKGAARDKIIKQLIEEERLRKAEAEKKARLAAAGFCPMGYEWIKQDSGYRCAGGSHFVSDAELP